MNSVSRIYVSNNCFCIPQPFHLQGAGPGATITMSLQARALTEPRYVDARYDFFNVFHYFSLLLQEEEGHLPLQAKRPLLRIIRSPAVQAGERRLHQDKRVLNPRRRRRCKEGDVTSAGRGVFCACTKQRKGETILEFPNRNIFFYFFFLFFPSPPLRSPPLTRWW